MTAPQRESLRHVIHEALATRHPSALTPRAIRRLAAPEMDCAITEEDVAGAVAMLSGMGYASSETDPLGATQYWQATAAGVLAWERGPGSER